MRQRKEIQSEKICTARRMRSATPITPGSGSRHGVTFTPEGEPQKESDDGSQPRRGGRDFEIGSGSEAAASLDAAVADHLHHGQGETQIEDRTPDAGRPPPDADDEGDAIALRVSGL